MAQTYHNTISISKKGEIKNGESLKKPILDTALASPTLNIIFYSNFILSGKLPKLVELLV